MTRFVCCFVFVRVAVQCLFVGQFSLSSEEGLNWFFSKLSTPEETLRSCRWIQTAVFKSADWSISHCSHGDWRQCREPGLGRSTDVSPKCQCSPGHLNKISPEAHSPYLRSLVQISAPHWSSTSREILHGLAAASCFHSSRAPVRACCWLHTWDRSQQPLWWVCIPC